MSTPTADYYDLATQAGRDLYSEHFALRAKTWAENFEEYPGGGDGEPYEAGQAWDLWVDVIERWEEDFGADVVSDLELSEQLGQAACAQVLKELVEKRAKPDTVFWGKFFDARNNRL